MSRQQVQRQRKARAPRVRRTAAPQDVAPESPMIPAIDTAAAEPAEQAAEPSVPMIDPVAAEPEAPPAPAIAAVPDGYMRDAQGRLVPRTMVREEQLVEDDLVRDLHKLAAMMSAELRAFRDKCMGEIQTLLALIAERYKSERGGAKGNLTLSTFDGMLRIQVAIGDQLTFGAGLQVAKTLVDDCIHDWSEGANDKLMAMVNGAFDVDKQGRLNVGRILQLRTLKIEDEKWQRAMTAISEAVRVERSKQYLRFYSRSRTEDRLEQVPLDLAAV